MQYLFSVFFLLFFKSSFTQKLTFDIFLFGNTIGQTVIEKNVKNDSITTYSLSSASEAHIFFTTRKISLHYDVIYKRGHLISSFSKSIRNDDVHVTSIRWQGNKYSIQREDRSFNIPHLIACSTVKLFFAEPCNAHNIFSERSGEFIPIKKTREGTYEADMKEGITYFYHYKNGKLIELEIRKRLLGSVFLKPVR